MTGKRDIPSVEGDEDRSYGESAAEAAPDLDLHLAHLVGGVRDMSSRTVVRRQHADGGERRRSDCHQGDKTTQLVRARSLASSPSTVNSSRTPPNRVRHGHCFQAAAHFLKGRAGRETDGEQTWTIQVEPGRAAERNGRFVNECAGERERRIQTNKRGNLERIMGMETFLGCRRNFMGSAFGAHIATDTILEVTEVKVLQRESPTVTPAPTKPTVTLALEQHYYHT
uniref:Uncharacterized protein n=1 Tax=Steinernema glaseri TaxID=37863 RepID=A0A1I7XWU4_9BILA